MTIRKNHSKLSYTRVESPSFYTIKRFCAKSVTVILSLAILGFFGILSDA